MKTPLKNQRYERFCHAFLVNFNGKKAAVEAGYPENSAAVMASKILAKKDVRARLRHLQKDFFAAKKLEREDVIQQLYYLVTRDVLDFADPKTGIINTTDLRQLPKPLRASIDGFVVRQLYGEDREVIGQEIRVSLSPKAKAVEMAMKHFSLFAPEEVVNKHTLTIDWDQLFESQAGKTPEVEKLIEELPQGGTQLIIR